MLPTILILCHFVPHHEVVRSAWLSFRLSDMSLSRYTMFGTCLLQSFSLTVCEADTFVASLIFFFLCVNSRNSLIKISKIHYQKTNKLLDQVCRRGVL